MRGRFLGRNAVSCSLLLVFCLVPAFTYATEYYIATEADGGDDDAAGTEAAPWATLQKAADWMSPGDTVYVKAGTYKERVKITKSGEPGKYITYRIFEENNVKLSDPDPSDCSWCEDEVQIWLDKVSYIKVIGFHIDGHMGNGIHAVGVGEYIEIRDCRISNQIYSSNVPMGQSHALIMNAWDDGHITTGPLQHIIIDNCEIDNNQTGIIGGGYNESMTMMGDVFDYQLTNNWVHHNAAIGIDNIGADWYDGGRVGRPDQGLIKGNTCDHNGQNYNWCGGIYSDGGGNGTPGSIICEENITFSNNEYGIEVGDEHNGETSGGWIVRRNISYDNVTYNLYMGSGWGANVTNNQVYNNVLFESQKAAIGLDAEGLTNTEFRNNIIYNTNAFDYVYIEDPIDVSVTFDYNCWYNGYSDSPLRGPNGINVDPKFLNLDPDNFDFHLQSDSPCIDAGVEVGVGQTFVGAAPDIGAFEYGETPGCTDNDGDGYGQGDDCLGSDCDDDNPDINPGEEEICDNQIDDDCDGKTDADDSDCDPVVDCTDHDGDGYGVGADCLGPDCDDDDEDVNPGEEEICDNQIDDDCDGDTDSSDSDCDPVVDCTDNDGDGYGQGADCLGPDCNDGNANVNPGMTELCNNQIDDDCDGDTDADDSDCTAGCVDNDGDGYGQGTDCLGPDCNDNDGTVNPGVVEICDDGIDNDCDDIIDVDCPESPGGGCSYISSANNTTGFWWFFLPLFGWFLRKRQKELM